MSGSKDCRLLCETVSWSPFQGEMAYVMMLENTKPLFMEKPRTRVCEEPHSDSTGHPHLSLLPELKEYQQKTQTDNPANG